MLRREDCWMTFSEALEQWFHNRMALGNTSRDSIAAIHIEKAIKEAADHMDALTGPYLGERNA